MKVLFIAIGAVLGALLRYLVQSYFKQFHEVLYGTLIANLLGCFLIGGISVLHIPDTYKVGLMTGLLGALTTMSSFSLEMYQLWVNQRWGVLVGMVIVTVFGGILFCHLGVQLATRVTSA